MKLLLDKGLYRAAAVKAAAAAFAELAEIKVVAKGEKIVVTIDRPAQDVDLQMVADEFLNHALAATVAARG